MPYGFWHEYALWHIHGRICPLNRLIKWLLRLRNWLSQLHSHKNLYIFIRDIFDKKILSYILQIIFQIKAQNLTIET